METCKRPLFKSEEFWLNNIKELYHNNNYLKFFPKYESSRIEQLNAITRLCIYFIILILLFKINNQWLYLPITIIFIIIIIFNIQKYDESDKSKELKKILDIRKNKNFVDREKIKEQMKHDGDLDFKLDVESEELQRNYDLEAGYIDSNGDLIVGGKYNALDKNDIDNEYSVAEMNEYKRNTCRRPTVNNPFMNPNITDFNDGDIPVACNVDDEDINESMKINFNHNLFRDVDEVWERENSQRQFYTVPNTTVPNNQVEFAKWLYKVPDTCKSDNKNGECLRYDDLRYRRR